MSNHTSEKTGFQFPHTYALIFSVIILAAFVDDMKQIAYGALIVGFARAIVDVLEDSQIIDTIIKSLASVISTLPNEFGRSRHDAVRVVINTFIPSGSGQAATRCLSWRRLQIYLHLNGRLPC
ncbi:hypothetical protein ACH95_03925 [Bacillus glycinifermentans]|uniref:Uncharacterized protein n=1 Tax=Bacillus glycinifermentans TaxID=1664069 RepID=A0A0J6HVR5_9BACI|nr:hypothetical protein [Bacillus glycinifermentans]KMM63082.1 hypothetical protein ACH95_03925 [Bacillus glycinifermentans]KRT95670.1 hypothetical protein AB447_200740 [Bacillus glycinifermentans]MEC0484448.1 hypothetical protein [Bacillus glycinifermentans]MEC0496839.1 hypothetical protein [Bacillus glycinifermentans]MEC0539657.1 hypothetical protein [Bacillus glycinifermentans]